MDNNSTDLVLKQYEDINEAGLRALNCGNITPWVMPTDLEQRHNISLLFSQSYKYQSVILEPLKKVETELTLLLAGRDYPLHATIVEAILPDYHNGKNIKADRVNNLFPVYSVTDLQIKLEWLLFEDNSLLLAAENIPDVLLEARQNMKTAYYDYFNTCSITTTQALYCVVARIVNLPNNKSAKMAALRAYQDTTFKIFDNVITDPIILKVQNVYQGSAYNLLNTKC